MGADMARNGYHGTLGVISFGLAVAITSAAFTFFLGLMATFFGWGVELAGALSSLYIGFSPTFVGTIAGAVWAFVDGFVAGIMIAWLYTRLLAYCPVVLLRFSRELFAHSRPAISKWTGLW